MESWVPQTAVFAAATVLVAVQIPRGALSFRPAAAARETAPAVAFVELDDAGYDTVMRKLHMTELSNPFGGRRNVSTAGIGIDAAKGVSALDETPPPVMPMAMEEAGIAPASPPQPSGAHIPDATLEPLSLAIPAPVAAPPPAEPDAPRGRDATAALLLDLDSYETLKGKE